jgi:hypothetical protein
MRFVKVGTVKLSRRHHSKQGDELHLPHVHLLQARIQEKKVGDHFQIKDLYMLSIKI